MQVGEFDAIEVEAGFEGFGHRPERFEFGLQFFSVRPRLGGVDLEPTDPVGDDLQIGQGQFFYKACDLLDDVAVAASAATAKGSHDLDQGLGFADHSESLKVDVLLASIEAGCVEQFDAGGDFLARPVHLDQPVETGVGDNRLADLAGMSLGRVGRGGRQQLEDRALAAALESNKSGFHCDDSAAGPRRCPVRLNRSRHSRQPGRRRGSSRSVVPGAGRSRRSSRPGRY